MFSSKIRVHDPVVVKDSEDLDPGKERIYQQGNPNLIGGDFNFPDDFGMSREALYPSKKPKRWNLFSRFMNFWLVGGN